MNSEWDNHEKSRLECPILDCALIGPHVHLDNGFFSWWARYREWAGVQNRTTHEKCWNGAISYALPKGEQIAAILERQETEGGYDEMDALDDIARVIHGVSYEHDRSSTIRPVVAHALSYFTNLRLTANEIKALRAIIKRNANL